MYRYCSYQTYFTIAKYCTQPKLFVFFNMVMRMNSACLSISITRLFLVLVM